MTKAYRYPARLSSVQTLTVLSYRIRLIIDTQSPARLKYLNTQNQCQGLFVWIIIICSVTFSRIEMLLKLATNVSVTLALETRG